MIYRECEIVESTYRFMMPDNEELNRFMVYMPWCNGKGDVILKELIGSFSFKIGDTDDKQKAKEKAKDCVDLRICKLING